LYPNEARLRSLTYASGLWVDVEKQTLYPIEENEIQKRVPIGTVTSSHFSFD
jgi:DNA-directed RNA polymerase beta subunit